MSKKKDKADSPQLSVFRMLEYWAADMEERRLSIRQKKAEEKLEKSKVLRRLEFHVAMADFLDDIRKMHKLDFGNVIQQTNVMFNAKLSDVAVAVSNIMNDAVSRICGQLLTMVDDINNVAGKRHDRLVNHNFALLEQLELMEENNQKRHNETMETLRLQDRRIDEFMQTTMNSTLSLLEKLTEAINTVGSNKPSLEWFVEHSDNIEQYARWLRYAKDNSMPRNTAVGRMARELCEMINVGHEDATAALDAMLDQQDGCNVHQLAA